ncbi:MAG TPA: hypothetical protein VIG24_17345 [Acidimicrobiia bacterium]
MMEREPLSEATLREEITLLREQEARLKQTLGRVYEERVRREAEYMAVRGDALLAQRVTDDWE